MVASTNTRLFTVILLFFFITFKTRVECYAKSMSLRYKPALEPQHIYVKQLFSD